MAALLVVCGFVSASTLSASVTLVTANVIDAKDASGVALPAGALGIVVIDTAGLGFANLSTDLTPTSINIDDVIGFAGFRIVNRLSYSVSAFGSSFQAGGTTFNTTISVPTPGPSATGDDVAVVWFPRLTAADTSIAVGQSFGIARDSDWEVPSEGAAVALTTVSAAGNAVFMVVPATVPEPTTSALILLSGVLLVTQRRRN